MGEPAVVAERYYAGLDARDAGAAAATLAPDCKVQVPGAVLEGPEQMQAWAQGFFDAFPDITHEHGELEEDGDRVSADLRISGTHTAPLLSPDGALPATGRSVTFEAHNELVVREGAIAEMRIDFDPGDLMRQLGVET